MMMWTHQADAHGGELPVEGFTPAPGKRTLTAGLVPRSAGTPLPSAIRTQFEASLGADLSAVRVHTGPDSAAAAAAMGARAFATGHDVHFAAGAYQPDDAFGLHLLAHEVAHTVQQSGAAQPIAQAKLAVSSAGDAAEVEADRAADAMVSGAPATVGRGHDLAIHRSTTPAPAAGVTPPPPPSPAVSGTTGGAENDPVVLPQAGPVQITFSDLHQYAFDLGELHNLGIGVGRLTSQPIPVGEFVSVAAELGSESPMHLTRPTVTLQPIIGSISAAEVESARAKDSRQSTAKTMLGGAAAAGGGILGGMLGPLAGMNPLRGAQAGGQAAGGMATAAVDAFLGDRVIRARLDQGEVQATLGLQYSPYLKLLVSGTGFAWLADIETTLQTNLLLEATATAALSGSEVQVHFRDGKLVRTEFTLRPSARFHLGLTADAVLRVCANLLPIYKDAEPTPGAERGFRLTEFSTAPFRLFQIDGHVGGGFELSMAREDRGFGVLGRGARVDPGAVRERFVAGLNISGSQLPFLRQRGDLHTRSATGMSKSDPIPMDWRKPWDTYAEELLWRPNKGGRARHIRKFPHQEYSDGAFEGPTMGVNDSVDRGKVMQRTRDSDASRSQAVEEFRKMLRDFAIYPEEQLGYNVDIDHVVDFAFDGADDATNLWPYESGKNKSAGASHAHQRVWWCPAPGRAPQRDPIHAIPLNRHFIVRDVF